MEDLKCPVCLKKESGEYLRLRGNGLIAMKCRLCGHVFIKNSPVVTELAPSYYTMDDFKGKRQLQDNNSRYADYYSHCFSDYESYLDSDAVLKQFKDKLGYINSRFPERGKLLDVGCATGVFLDMARKQGWGTQGVETSAGLASYARNNFSLRVDVVDLTKENLAGGPFDVISLFDVIEHLPDINRMAASCRKLLSDNGLFLIRTPLEEGLLRNIAKAVYWGSLTRFELPMFWFYSFEHVQSFSMKSMKTFLENNDFSIVKIFREEESLDRLNIPRRIRFGINGVNLLSALLRKQHKVTVVARKK